MNKLISFSEKPRSPGPWLRATQSRQMPESLLLQTNFVKQPTDHHTRVEDQFLSHPPAWKHLLHCVFNLKFQFFILQSLSHYDLSLWVDFCFLFFQAKLFFPGKKCSQLKWGLPRNHCQTCKSTRNSGLSQSHLRKQMEERESGNGKKKSKETEWILLKRSYNAFR